MYNDLKVKGGRLINESPKNPEMGITRIARQVKEMKKQEKVGMMRDAFYQAEMMSEAKEMIMEMKLGKKY
jgi:predicted ATP-grasp superfamily ATP-dependent carboligase